jgi:hypothetical protein
LNAEFSRPPVIPPYIPQGAHINPAFLAKLHANNNMMNMNSKMGMDVTSSGMGIHNAPYTSAYPRPYADGRYQPRPRPPVNYLIDQRNDVSYGACLLLVSSAAHQNIY